MADVARLDKYANWLIQNKDKKGTPDFDKVANAYRALRPQDTPPANDNTDNSDNTDNTGINSPTSGFMEAIAQGVDAPLDAMGTTASVLGYEKTGEFLTNLTEAPEGYESASAKFIKGDPDQFLGYDYKYLPKATIEQGAQFVGQLGARAGGAALGSTLGPAGAIGGAIVAPMVLSAAQHLGPMALERASNQGRDKPNMDDFLYVSTSTAGIALLDSIGLGGKSKVLMTALKEFGTEGLQSVVEQVGTSVNTEAGLNVDPKQAFGEAIIGGTSSGTVSTAISTVSKTGEVVFKPRQELDPEVDQAAADVARMLKEISSKEGLNLKNIDPSSKKGANTALDTARSKNTVDINTAAQILREDVLKGADKATLERFNQAVKNANTKVGSVVSNEDIQFIKDTVGKALEGQQLVQSMYKSNVVTELYAAGLKGGFSKFTDVFNPLPQIGKSYDPARSIGTMLNLGAVAGTGGTSLATQIPLVIGGRAIDAVTGRRSKVNRFVKKNTKNAGMPSPVGVVVEGRAKRIKAAQASASKAKIAAAKAKIAAAKAVKAKDQAAQNVVKYNEGYAPNYGDARLNQRADPRGTMHNALAQKASLEGMSIKEIDAEIQRIIDARLADKRTSKEEKKSLRTYADFNKLGAMPKGDQTLSLAIAAIRDRFNFTEPNPASPTTPTQQRSPEVQQGIDDNRKFVQNLVDKLGADKAVTDKDRLVLENSLSEYQLSLGKDPRTASQAIIDRARKNLSNGKLADKYLMPYHTRVVSQQAAINTGVDKPNEPTGTTGSPRTAVPPPPPVLDPQSTPAPAPEETTGGTQQEPNVGDGGGQGVLGTPDPVGTRPPKPDEVQAELPEAEALIEIGKKGTKYENGIQDWATALDAAKKLGLVVKLFKSITALKDAAATRFGTIEDGTQAFFHEYGNKGGAGGTIFTLLPNASNGLNKETKKLKRVTDMQALTTLLHEIAHGVAEGNLSGKGISNPRSKSGINVVTGQRNKYGDGTFTGSIIAPVLMDKNLTKNSPIFKEIVNLQWNIRAYAENNPNTTKAVRSFSTIVKNVMAKNPSMTKDEAVKRFSTEPHLKKYQKYAMNFSESAVDPLWVYMFNPKLAKELMPETTKVIRDEFKKAGNKQIRFYSSSFATILAIVSAMVAMEAGEEEEPQMPNGALSPQSGGVLAA